MRSLCVLALLTLNTLALAAPLAPTPLATVGKTDKPPAIDGKLDDACWQAGASAVLSNFVLPDMSALATVQTEARLCYDAQKLYLGVRCEEPNIASLRAYSKTRDEAVWRDDCIEIFLDANHDRKSYYHVIVNSLGTIFDASEPGDESWNAAIEAKASVGDDSWTAELAIPFADLGGAPEVGAIWGFNLGRERYAGEENLSIWSPTYAKFHEPDRFGEIVFAETPAGVVCNFEGEPSFGLNNAAVFTVRAAAPSVSILRDWPGEVPRDWETPAPKVEKGEAVQSGQAWQARYRLVDGSETALVIEQKQDGNPVFRQAFPVNITPQPRTAALAGQLLALEGRFHPRQGNEGQVAGYEQFSEEIGALLAEGRETLMGFIQGNLTRADAMSAQEWRQAATAQEALLARLGGLAYVVWTKSPWEGLERDEMPSSLYPNATVSLSACSNEIESGDFVITNLSDRLLEGRLKISALRLIRQEQIAAEAAANLLENSDFSLDADEDGIPDGWRRIEVKGSYALEKQEDGSTAFVLSGGKGEAVKSNFRQTVSLKPGEQYTLIAELSAENLLPGTGYVHVINNGWTWSTAVQPVAPSSGRMQYLRSFTAPTSDSFQVVLRLESPAGGTIKFHSVKLLEGGAKERLFSSDCIAVHDVLFQDLRVGRTVADPLPKMNEARTIRVAPGESRQVWLNLDTSALPPGDYRANVTITPFDRELPTKTVPLQVSVLPVRLPDKMPIAVYNWDYAKDENYVRDLAAHRNNTFLINTGCRAEFDENGNLTKPVDWSSYDKLLQVKLRYARECGGIVLFSYGIIRDFNSKYSRRFGWDFMSEPWKKAFKTWVQEFERHLRDDIGMSYDEYAVQLWDEATGQNAELTVQGGEFLRSFAPKVRTCMDGAQSVAEVKAMDHVIDLWIPHQSALYHRAEAEELRALYKTLMDKGEPVWTYTCSTNMKALDPLDYYRLKEWRVWDLGVQGSCYWAYNSWRGDPWNDFDGPIADCGTIYDGPDGPISSRRWEATREGRDDYLYLHMLRRAGERAGGETQARIDALLTSLVKEVLASPKDLTVFEAARARLIEVLRKYCGSDPAKLTKEPEFATAKGRATCTWATDEPSAGRLFYRVPGDAAWQTQDFDTTRAHSSTLTGLPLQRNFEWYLLWWSEGGAMSFDLSGLEPEGWFSTGGR